MAQVGPFENDNPEESHEAGPHVSIARGRTLLAAVSAIGARTVLERGRSAQRLHARLGGPAVGAAGEPRLLALLLLRLVLRLMRLLLRLRLLLWLRLLLALLAVHVRRSLGRRCDRVKRLVSQARMMLVASRRLLRARQRSCASHTAFGPSCWVSRGWERSRRLLAARGLPQAWHRNLFEAA